MNFERVEEIASAVLYEGYILYPYRKSAIKNRQRWNFGTLYPRVYAEAQHEPSCLVAEVVAILKIDSTLHVKASFLQLVAQKEGVETRNLSDPSLAWEEAVERSYEASGLKLQEVIDSPFEDNLHLAGAVLPGEQCGAPACDLKMGLSVSVESLRDTSCKIRVELRNLTPLLRGVEARRDEALPSSFVSAHVVLGITGGEFVSLLDPPTEHKSSVATCTNVGVFPVLAGKKPDHTLMLCSPIILYDYPQIAPESEGDFFDGTEMDEMLTLRVLTLTDAEKQEVREGDPRARRILERTEALTGEAMLKAHGVVRSLREIGKDLT